MRKLLFKDVFALSAIIEKIGVKIKPQNEDGTEKSASEIGAEVIGALFTGLHKAENEICTFLSSIFEVKTEDIQNADIETMTRFISEFKGDDGLRNFLKQVSKLKGLKS